ncbi:MAG: PLP-dependent aminotransferase family protein [Clostridia bacterium]|nr:PLP-dependent aminotransferase family protein [Clostridia bacterium]
MNHLFAKRVFNTPKSFIREILKVTQDKEVISFAGGLPNPSVFPVDEIKASASKVLQEDGNEILQYTVTEGYYPLRKFISDRYRTQRGLDVSPEEILVTSGSQQGLDLIGKVFLNEGDSVAIERPGYLGAIQAFSLFEPRFSSIPLLEDGIDMEALDHVLNKEKVKLFYGVPNFQNPSGVTYSEKKRILLSFALRNTGTLMIEDDAYGELRFKGNNLPLVKSFNKEGVLLLGSFSKIVSPGLRLGWICAEKHIIEKLVTVKQASDLHSDYLSQRVVYQYIMENDIDAHIAKIRRVYGKQRDFMVEQIQRLFPEEIKYTKPEGGMFLWATLPQGIKAMEVFEEAIKENVAFVPGNPFYTGEMAEETMRLNFSNSDEGRIEEGIKRLSKVLKKVLQ